jgi:diguanylate cyclase (GGDEF)-like protein
VCAALPGEPVDSLLRRQRPDHAHARNYVKVAAMNQVQLRRLAQEVEDTYQRALTGGPFYLLAWLIVGIYGGAFERKPLASGLLALGFIGLAGTRFLHRPVQEADAAARVRWLRVHWGIVMFTTLLWGAVFCWALLDPGFRDARTAALLSTLGLATAVAHAFSMRRGFALACIGLLYAPGLLLLWTRPADRSIALVMLVYLGYVLISLARSHAEYQQRLDLDQELRDQRDLFSRQSKIDPLTELANRRHFSDVLAEVTARAIHSGEPMSLLVLDLDHFKKINDTHGHAIGDACLVAVAGRLRSLFSGERDLPARLGGEEFGVVLDGQDLATAMQRAEHFRANLVEHPIAMHGSAGGMVLPMTTSIGIAEFDNAIHRDVDELYSAADRAVYRAKAAGRNRVCRDEATPAR